MRNHCAIKLENTFVQSQGFLGTKEKAIELFFLDSIENHFPLEGNRNLFSVAPCQENLWS